MNTSTALAASLLALSLSGCCNRPHETTKASQTAVAANASRIAAHVEAAQATVSASVELTAAHRLAAEGNLSAALAALPRPAQTDRDFVAALKSAADYKRAATEAESRALVADRALSEAEAAAATEREGREQDRRDADARIWRIAAVGLFLAGVGTAYALKTYARSALLAAGGIACALVPALVGRLEAVPWWAVLVPVVVAAAWAAWRLWHAPPPISQIAPKSS